MSQVMGFSERLDFRTLLEIECKSLTGFAPVIHDSCDDFKSMLSLFEEIEVLVIDDPNDDEVFKKILHELRPRQDQIKHIILLSNRSPLLKNVQIFKNEEIDKLVAFVKNLIRPKNELKVDGYISIPVESLVHFKILPIDLYVKLSDDRFVKRIPAHEEIDDSTVMNFKRRGINDLFFERQHNREFSTLLINNMINKVERDYSSIQDKLKASDEVFSTTHEIVTKLGFKSRVIDVCESVMTQISEDVMSGKNQFSTFLNQLRNQTDLSFRYRLMELSSFIATQMIQDLKDGNKTETVKKIVFACMFSDVTLKKEGQIHLRRNDQIFKLSSAEQQEINEHALRASELVTMYRQAPADVDQIIKHSHGSLTGVGMPTDIHPKIHHLAKYLLAAQEISYAILMETDRHPIDVLSDVKIRFIGTPLEDHFILFEKTCQYNLQEAAE